MTPALSVLDLVPVRTGQSSADAVAASLALARRADELGYTRYWFAEHHNMPSVASTTPPVLIAAVAARTERIRVGSGGVMLPNHAPLVVAEQFAALEALAPGRIDLGIGRAPGSDPVISALLRSSGPTSEVDRFEEHLGDIRALAGDGATVTVNTRDGLRDYEVRATPAAAGLPELWLLGSSEYSAHLAAKLGLPYVFAHHFSGEGTEFALDVYRREFRASETLAAPRTFLTLNVVVADTAEEAEARALPALQNMARLRTGKPLRALDTVETAEREELDTAARHVIELMRERWVVGAPDAAAARIRELAERFGVDEVMVSPGAGSREDEPVDRAVGRERTLELLAERLPATSAADPVPGR
ncbi:LLM class flavin-dependent oxidoreductase [Protaetiibacter intestinalis]|uniref:LLM class flavin-dependent oxidoreductase n=1 Tax=Protaetiibacter intestinalis TaxID=2419774 RepID=A0A387BDA2_9MICO|nr:LLM class flavin-dependent oxidoreductase [Protaetiibacter intestinalis]AYF98859.1 LLM class flavin-dependent oxidoreductase [Protaetiibacter intestinalis]